MKEWKIAQDVFHRLNRNHEDDLKNVDITFSDETVKDAILHFNHKVDRWIYPAKSYFVAICYASWITEDFGENFYEVLSDQDLLAGNDPYFIPYEKDPEIYDRILEVITLPLPMRGMVGDVRKYYESEFDLALKKL